ncbi:hypothetical protein JRI60_26705 [Archangium violaceum]|uniref:hypothetical protein n=1 Tax=Archangium violaceum TaxID=83451 RepID=UPI001951E70D|nr:hypothetical protein [Archangium violaceum]QRN92804.1 hypothetical protein JRI60_26705 [Archangium violaceum]
MTLCVLVLGLPTAVLAGEQVFLFRTEESSGAVDTGGCRAAPFEVNVRLPANVFVRDFRAGGGKKGTGGERLRGKALACAHITDPSFAEGSTADFYVHFILPEGHFTGLGRCTMVSNGVPRPGLVLTSCALKLTEFPAGYVGGFVTSSSVFNPKGLPGYNTGSFWTLRVFEPDTTDTRGGKVPAPGPGRSRGAGP